MTRQTDAETEAVRLRFYLPPEDLQPLVTTIYQLDFRSDDGTPIEDRLHPEWGNLRLFTGGTMEAAVGGGPLEPVPAAVVVGPTSKATRFRTQAARTWGVGLLPLGWARIIDLPASEHADSFFDMARGPLANRLAPLRESVERSAGDPAAVRDSIVAALRKIVSGREPREEEIVALEHALVDPKIHTVADLAEKAGMSLRSLERLSNAVFGFPPQLLLRRQRFLRSLALFMLDPSLKWIDALDSHYHDQAHFVRDFKRFMGMSPSTYAKLPHPVLGAATRTRKAIAGEAMQVLHRPPGEA
ncbi:helix-turn-helix domain-containing protein [Qipengyuania sp. 6B39]|uniref:helix-turn-helix domain-containing protein n=1 Tax=Qipengyuania proteolytica TaxID=2867239 RepID=UPI001C8B064F|nr:helix-turn-helix domain-containing protein [Qipengyuania proteolytica]MBX7494483.1 helix-turn-helix domain-containing protein [Qipengyuania proteolytica]